MAQSNSPQPVHFHRNLRRLCAAVALALLTAPASAQFLTLANPHWNITLSDFGYSDFLLDNTPGFEGREYLSGEWGAAVGYTLPGGTAVAPRFLDPQFYFPDWPTLSTFTVVTPLTQTGLNADGLPIAQSVIANGLLEITLRHEMLDTVVGTPMGLLPASSVTGELVAINSSRYVLKQTATVRNISGAALSNVQFFQLLHGLQAQRGLYDNHPHAGPLSQFQYDITQAGVDAWAVGPGSSGSGLEDYIGFHASAAPSAFENGYYGIEGNGVDAHSIGKPTDGVHLSIEDNWLHAPYSARQGTDYFAPPTRWIGGAQRWNLGALAANQSASLDVLLTVRSGTRVASGTGSTGGCNGGSGVPGGVDYEIEQVSSDGSCFGEYAQADAAEVEARIVAGEFSPFTFQTPGGPAQLWKLQFSGAYAGNLNLTFGYDPAILPAGFSQESLSLYEYDNGSWHKLATTVNAALHTLSAATTQFAVYALGVDALVSYAVDTSVEPLGGGAATGAGSYAQGSSVTLAAVAAAGYAFTNWTVGGSPVSVSPSYTFSAQADQTLVANFVAVGAARAIATSSLPASGGTTSGDGARPLGSSATVSAQPAPGYKFSKWLENGVSVSTAKDYTFTVAGNRTLVAKFKPVYAVSVTAEPPDAGDVEADPQYEPGELAKLKAKPQAGYSFVNWTQNGVPVSTDPYYQFNVAGNRDLVGNFALGNRIDASAEPYNAGSVAGKGVHPDGSEVTLVATAQPGYVFVNWTEAGDPVSPAASYTFTSGASRVLVANFIAQPALAQVPAATGELTFAWPSGASGWVLQECDDLALGNWVDSVRPPALVGSQKRVTVTPTAGRCFFRLIHP